eukprot:CAMPEP_0185724872 /NCGR_PEP_ID=MMETSP1171-20130828/1231_1 /TAXON_ID=374046 /ORGANISM="Helicotheca tamensis, Strain CCMP826" /LENGTH=310 /DNA_ID=CAMNT_0028392821 /DNA_START=93 /DNA_END=1025 /DNA_ORIENTATION=-
MKSKIFRHHKIGSLNEEQDNRPLISDLLNENSSAIKIVRDTIQKDPLYDSNHYDDIWILRFVLSHKKKTEDAINAALKTIMFRHERKLNELGDIRHKMPNHINKCESENYFPCHRVFMKYCEGNDATMHTLSNKDRGIISYILLAKVAIKEIAEELSDEELQDIYLYLNECQFQVLDATTRRTGRLTKALRVVDMTDMALRKFDLSYAKKDLAASKATEDYYPQLLGSMLIVNGPSWLDRVWIILRPLFPRRVTAKINFVSPKKRPQDVKPFLSYTTKDDLPTRYGGNNEEWPLACAGALFEKHSDMNVD